MKNQENICFGSVGMEILVRLDFHPSLCVQRLYAELRLYLEKGCFMHDEGVKRTTP